MRATAVGRTNERAHDGIRAFDSGLALDSNLASLACRLWSFVAQGGGGGGGDESQALQPKGKGEATVELVW